MGFDARTRAPLIGPPNNALIRNRSNDPAIYGMSPRIISTNPGKADNSCESETIMFRIKCRLSKAIFYRIIKQFVIFFKNPKILFKQSYILVESINLNKNGNYS